MELILAIRQTLMAGLIRKNSKNSNIPPIMYPNRTKKSGIGKKRNPGDQQGHGGRCCLSSHLILISRVWENLLKREFQAGYPGEKRVSDIMCPQTQEGWLYMTGRWWVSRSAMI
jgi:hypothetical protein